MTFFNLICAPLRMIPNHLAEPLTLTLTLHLARYFTLTNNWFVVKVGMDVHVHTPKRIYDFSLTVV